MYRNVEDISSAYLNSLSPIIFVFFVLFSFFISYGFSYFGFYFAGKGEVCKVLFLFAVVLSFDRKYGSPRTESAPLCLPVFFKRAFKDLKVLLFFLPTSLHHYSPFEGILLQYLSMPISTSVSFLFFTLLGLIQFPNST